MRVQTEFFKDGDAMAIRTNAQTEESFIGSVVDILDVLIDDHRYEHDWEFQLRFWLPQIIDIACKLRGYKSDVHEERVLTAGWMSPLPAALVSTSVGDTDTQKATITTAPAR